MTEHCANNGTSICQTVDATHLILGYDQFKANSTLGFTYTEKQADLMFHTTSDPDAVVYTVKLCVTNISNRKWYVLTYENPYDCTTTSVLKALEPYAKVELYAVKEPDFLKRDKLIIFIRIDYDVVMLGIEEIDHEQQVRLWRCLELLQREPELADMTVNGLPAHRAVVAMASDSLDHSIAALPYIRFACDDKLDSKIAHASDMAGNDATTDCEELLPKNTIVCSSGVNKEFETKKIDDLGAASTSGATESKTDILKMKYDEKFAVFTERANAHARACSPKADIIAKLIEDLKDVMQDVKVINHSEELELLDLKKPYPENYSFSMDLLTNELQSTVFLRYVYIGPIDNLVPCLEDTAMTGNTPLMTMIDDLLQAAIRYELPSLVHTLQKLMIESLIHEKTVQGVLQLAKKFDLDDVKLGAIDFLRGKNVALFDNPSLYEFVISKPGFLTNNKQQTQNKQQTKTKHYQKPTFTFERKKADFHLEESRTFMFAGIPVFMRTRFRNNDLEVSLQAEDEDCDMDIYMSVSLRSTNLVRKVEGYLPSIEIKNFITNDQLHFFINYISDGTATFDVVLEEC